MLYNIEIVYGDGRITDEIIHSNKPLTIHPKQDNIVSSKSSIHKYEIESTLPPTIYKSSQDNKVYLVPMWIEVHPQTTYDDVVWIRPKAKKIIEHIDGSMGKYKTTYDPNKKTYKCTCMGFWRSKGNCKHVKALKEKNLVIQSK
jgi:type III secretion system FlhB-like substrate exporter